MNQKLENLLQMALQTPKEQREKTLDLNVGFDQNTKTWELIVKYHGSLDVLRDYGIVVEYLIAGYAILTVPENLVEQMAQVEQIEYIEKPKRYFYGQESDFINGGLHGRGTIGRGFGGREFSGADSCIESLISREPILSGEGVLIAVIDSGISFWLPEFRKEDGTTKIRYLWDQTLDAEYDAMQINEALHADTSQERYRILPSVDTSGHGTAVAAIAVADSARYRGIAPGAELLVVKLGVASDASFPRTTQIMRAVTYVVNKAVELGMPLVVNLSFGNTYGSHDGSSLLERFLDNASEIGRTVICVGSGNEGNNNGHVAGSVTGGQTGRENGRAGARVEIELAIANYERGLSVQLWKNYRDMFRITLRSPGGEEEIVSDRANSGKYSFRLEQTDILLYYGEPLPYSVAQEVYFEFIPAEGTYITPGIWTFVLEAESSDVNSKNPGAADFYFYLPSGTTRSSDTGFFRPSADVTLTIPSTAAKVLTVGAYSSVYDAYADFSGRGYPGNDRTVGVVTSGLTKPDLVAPGVDILVPDIYGGYIPVTGTSFATPIVSASAALLMEWGIIRGNDRFLYGEKVKAYLRKGAQPLRGESDYPNERVGWGKLCLARSLPR